MVVPYRDPGAGPPPATAFDIGEWGLGFMTTSLELGCDCLGEIRYLDAVLHDSHGEPYTIRNAICLHEEDDGVLWKHVDERGRRRGAPEAADGGELPRHRGQLRVPRLLALLPDGTIECEVRATGIMVTSTVRRRGARRTARSSTTAPTRRSTSTSSSPGWTWTSTAPENTVVVSETAASPPIGAGQPVRAAASPPATSRSTEVEGVSDPLGPPAAWKVVNRDQAATGSGGAGRYKLVPSAPFPAMLRPGLGGAPARRGRRSTRCG